MAMADPFAGDRKSPMVSPLAGIEKQFIEAWVDRFPPWIQSHQLTMLTVLWTIGVIWFGWLARVNRAWLWASSLMILLQWFTDCFDGALGRRRDAGLVRWGYYMDHFLDFLFMSAIYIGYALMLYPGSPNQGPVWAIYVLFALMLLYGAFMVNAFLVFSITNEFKITYLGLGPTEVRLLFILLNLIIIGSGAGFLVALLPWALLLYAFMLFVVVLATHRSIWDLDLRKRKIELRRRDESNVI